MKDFCWGGKDKCNKSKEQNKQLNYDSIQDQRIVELTDDVGILTSDPFSNNNNDLPRIVDVTSLTKQDIIKTNGSNNRFTLTRVSGNKNPFNNNHRKVTTYSGLNLDSNENTNKKRKFEETIQVEQPAKRKPEQFQLVSFGSTHTNGNMPKTESIKGPNVITFGNTERNETSSPKQRNIKKPSQSTNKNSGFYSLPQVIKFPLAIKYEQADINKKVIPENQTLGNAIKTSTKQNSNYEIKRELIEREAKAQESISPVTKSTKELIISKTNEKEIQEYAKQQKDEKQVNKNSQDDKLLKFLLAINYDEADINKKVIPDNQTLGNTIKTSTKQDSNFEIKRELIEREEKAQESISPVTKSTKELIISKTNEREILEHVKQQSEGKQVKKKSKEDKFLSREFSKLSYYKRKLLKQEAEDKNETTMQCLKRKLEERSSDNYKIKVAFKKTKTSEQDTPNPNSTTHPNSTTQSYSTAHPNTTTHLNSTSNPNSTSTEKRKLQPTNEETVPFKHQKLNKSALIVASAQNNLVESPKSNTFKDVPNVKNIVEWFESETGKKPVVSLEKLNLSKIKDEHAQFRKVKGLSKSLESEYLSTIHPFKCGLCKATFSKANELLNHAKMSHNELSSKLNSNVLNAPAPQDSSIREKTETNNVSLERLDIMFDNAIKAAKLNKQPTSNPTGPNKEFPHNCKICSEGFKLEELLKLHLNLIHHITASFACFLCNLAFNNTSGIKAHIKYVHEILKCTHCQKQFANKFVLLTHMKCKHNKLIDEFKCEACNRYFAKSEFLERHLSVDHPNYTTTQQLSGTSSGPFTNPPLKKIPPQAAHLKSGEVQSMSKSAVISSSELHLKPATSHSTQTSPVETLPVKVGDQKITSFRCSTCPVYFNNRSAIEAHMKYVHPATTNTKKTVSEIKPSKPALFANVKKEQTVIEPVQHLVNLPISLPSSLSIVKIENNNSKPLSNEQGKPRLIIPSIKCLICSQNFSNMTLHDIHVRTHHKPQPHLSNETNFKAKLRVLQDVSNLKNRPMTESDQGKKTQNTSVKGVTGFKCKTCNKGFAHKGFYEKHLRTMHIDQNMTKTAESQPAKTAKPAGTINKKTWPFSCGKCGMGFDNQILVVQHVRIKHAAVQPMKSSRPAAKLPNFPNKLFDIQNSRLPNQPNQIFDKSKIKFVDPMTILQKGLDELSQTLKSSFTQNVKIEKKDPFANNNNTIKKAKMMNDEYWSYLNNMKNKSFDDLNVKKAKRFL